MPLATESRTFTLNRAHKVVQRLKDLVSTESDGLGGGYVGSIGYDEAGQRALAKGVATAAADLVRLQKVLELHVVVGMARDAIAKANVAHNVTSLMAEERWLASQIATLRTQLAYLSRGADRAEYALRFEEHNARVAEQMRLSAAAGTALPRPHSSSLDVNFVEASVAEGLAAQMKALEARKVAVADKIADANAEKVLVVLPTEYLKDLLGE